MDGVGQAFDGVWACGLLGGRGRRASAGSGWPSLTFAGDGWCWWAISVGRAVRRSVGPSIGRVGERAARKAVARAKPAAMPNRTLGWPHKRTN